MAKVSTFALLALFAASAWAGDQRTVPPAPTAPRGASPAVQPQAMPPAAKPLAAPAKAAKPRLPDAQLEAAIRAKFAKSKSAPEKFTVHVQGGVATIEGKTDVVQHKGGATRMAKSAGAVAVVNHIEVSEAAKQKASGNLEEGRRRAQVKRGDSRGDSRGDARQQAAPPVTQTPAQRKGQ